MSDRYLSIESAIEDLKNIFSPHNNEIDEDDWWSCTVYIDVDNFNVRLFYEKRPPDAKGECWVTHRCQMEFTMQEIAAHLKSNNLWELEKP